MVSEIRHHVRSPKAPSTSYLDSSAKLQFVSKGHPPAPHGLSSEAASTWDLAAGTASPIHFAAQFW